MALLDNLTGKAREKFQKWLLNSPYKPCHIEFYSLSGYPNSMIWGVLVDWTDSEGYNIEILISPVQNTMYSNKFDASIFYQNNEIWSTAYEYETRHEAREAAVKELNRIINEKG